MRGEARAAKEQVAKMLDELFHPRELGRKPSQTKGTDEQGKAAAASATTASAATDGAQKDGEDAMAGVTSSADGRTDEQEKDSTT